LAASYRSPDAAALALDASARAAEGALHVRPPVGDLRVAESQRREVCRVLGLVALQRPGLLGGGAVVSMESPALEAMTDGIDGETESEFPEMYAAAEPKRGRYVFWYSGPSPP